MRIVLLVVLLGLGMGSLGLPIVESVFGILLAAPILFFLVARFTDLFADQSLGYWLVILFECGALALLALKLRADRAGYNLKEEARLGAVFHKFLRG